MKRRNFIKKAGITGMALPIIPGSLHTFPAAFDLKKPENGPVCIATWNFHEASKKAGELLASGSSALDAVEQGVRVEESNIENTTVGIGGTPDREGEVSLDACIMAPNGNAGSVAYLKHIEHPVSVARKVMEKTPHVMLVGEGALNFALQNGFEKQDLLNDKTRAAYQEWLKEKEYQPIINIENHDTIGMLCLDKDGDIAGACTTSGLAYKMQGRVGDSPIIGAGLFVDNKIGGAAATGMGEEIIKNVCSFLAVEFIRQGKSPQEACKMAVMRVVERNPGYKDFQVAVIALNKKGETGGYAIHKGFSYMLNAEGKNENIPGASYVE